MHRLKKVTLEVTMGLFISLSACAADDDGTFTITIQGPEVEETVPASRPVRTTPRRQAVIPQQAPAATVAPRQSAQVPQRAVAVPAQTAVSSDQFRTYNVVSGDTIWSVAHRYAQLNRSINEFQVVASIYRNNPQAFGGGNVNNLLRTTLRIPSDALIAQENTQTEDEECCVGSCHACCGLFEVVEVHAFGYEIVEARHQHTGDDCQHDAFLTARGILLHAS